MLASRAKTVPPLSAALMLALLSASGCGWESDGLHIAASSPRTNGGVRGYPITGDIPPPPARPGSTSVASGGIQPASVAALNPVRNPARAQPATTRTVTVLPGDTVYALSRRYGVSARSIIDANALRPPYHLAPGQRLTIPSDHLHIVRRGETLYSISRAYGVDVYTLASANGLVAPYDVPVGHELRVPGEPRQQQVAAVASAEMPSVTVASVPPAVVTTSRMPPVAPPAPAPALTSATSGYPLAPPPPAPQNGTAMETTMGGDNGFETAALPVTPPLAAPADVPPPPVPSGNGFMWPVQGKVISPFGPKTKGLHNDGINIAAERGAPVRAAENGVVAYAGNELRGFGNMVLIRHAGGWVTAYAHNDELLVRRGDQIRRGEIIARVGSSGSVTEPQLHFELRKGKQTVDPRRYLGKGSA